MRTFNEVSVQKEQEEFMIDNYMMAKGGSGSKQELKCNGKDHLYWKEENESLDYIMDPNPTILGWDLGF